MKKNVLATLMMIIFAMATICGCGNNNTEDTKNNSEVVSSVAEETEKETEENNMDVETTETVIGDVDATPDALSMDDMVEQVVGLDIPLIKNAGTDETAFNNFTVLFPSSEYITEYYEDGAGAKLEAIDFEISIVLMNGEPNNNIREDMGESQEYIGDYVLEKSAGGNDDIGYQMTYNIVKPSCNTMLNITITVNKNRDYQEYCNALVEEFAPKFEESILKNIQ